MGPMSDKRLDILIKRSRSSKRASEKAFRERADTDHSVDCEINVATNSGAPLIPGCSDI